MNRKIAIIAFILFLFIIPVSNAVNLPNSNVGSLSFPISSSSNLPIPSYLFYSILISFAVMVIVSAALRMTQLKSGAYMIGIIVGFMVLFYLYSNPNLANTLGNIIVVYSLFVLVLASLIALARKGTNPIMVLFGLILLFILFYLVILNNKPLQSYLNNTFHVNTTNFMSLFIPYIIGLVLIYVFYRIFYKRLGMHILGSLIMLATAIIFFVPGAIFFWWLLVVLVIVALIIGSFYHLAKRKMNRGFNPKEAKPNLPPQNIPKENLGSVQETSPKKNLELFNSGKPSIIPFSSRSNPNKHWFLFNPGKGKGGGFATKEEIEKFKAENPPPQLYLDIKNEKSIIAGSSRSNPKRHWFLLSSGKGKGGGFATKEEIEKFKKENPPPKFYLKLKKDDKSEDNDKK